MISFRMISSRMISSRMIHKALKSGLRVLLQRAV